MDSSLNRRSFLGVTAVASAATLAHTRLYRFLASPDAATKVMSILSTHLELDVAVWPLVEDFTASLGGAGHHIEPAAYFEQMALNIGTEAELASYVVQEFFVSTNYLAYYKKEAPKLAMLSDLAAPNAAAV